MHSALLGTFEVTLNEIGKMKNNDFASRSLMSEVVDLNDPLVRAAKASSGKWRWGLIICLLLLLLPACGRRTPAIRSIDTSTDSGSRFFENGIASWYGPGFHGRTTANGERYDMYAMTAAHKQLPFDTRVRVVNLDNGESTIVRVNDRGPFIEGRVIDLSRSAAEAIDMVGPGTAQVDLYILDDPRAERVSSSPDRTGALSTRGQAFTVQVGAFRHRANANRLKARLADQFPDVTISEIDQAGQTLFRICVGIFGSRESATEFRQLLLEEGVVKKAVVVHSGK